MSYPYRFGTWASEPAPCRGVVRVDEDDFDCCPEDGYYRVEYRTPTGPCVEHYCDAHELQGDLWACTEGDYDQITGLHRIVDQLRRATRA